MPRPPWRPGNDRPQAAPAGGELAPPSRTDRKRAADVTRDLARELMALNAKALATVPLEADLREAIELGRGITKHGGRRRQMQFVAKFLRTIDTSPIAAALDRLRHHRDTAVLRTHTVESWRERLLAEGDVGIAALREERPGQDFTELVALVHDARRELTQGDRKRAFRELFPVLWDLLSV
jgi:ribosome-associated protein